MALTLAWLDNLEAAIIRDPLQVSPDTPLDEVISLIINSRGNCYLHSSESNSLKTAKQEGRGSCVIIVENNQPIGIVTERNIIQWIAQEKHTEKIKVKQVMSQPVVTLQYEKKQDIFAAINLFREHSIRHLPIVDQGNLIGLITYDTIRGCLQPEDLLRFRTVSEVMNRQVIVTTDQTPLLTIAQLMANHHISCVVIVAEDAHQNPVGMITERDLVQFKKLGLDWNHTPALSVMSYPILKLSPDNNLSVAHQMMESNRIGRLIITGNQGELLGLITRTNILQILEPLEVYNVIELLEAEVKHLQDEKIQLLESKNLNLQQTVQEQTEKLYYREQEFQLIVETAPDIIFRIDLDLKYLYFNHAVEKLVGVTAQDLIGKYPEEIGIDQDVINIWKNCLQKAIETKQEQTVDYPYPTINSSIWYQTRLVPEYSPDGTLISFLGIARDITPQKQAEKKLYQQLELEKILYKVTINIRQSLSLKEILNTTVTEIRQLLDCDRVLVYQFDAEFNGQIVAESVTVQGNSILGISLEDTCFKRGGAKHYLQGRKNSINNIETADISPCYYNLLSDFNVKANLVVPIVINDPVSAHQLWGLLIAHHCIAPREWSSDELHLLDQLAVSISIAIQQSQLYQQIQHELKERCKAEDALIKLNGELERRVRERTIVLSQTNQQLLNEIQEHRRTEKKLHRQNIKVELFTDITLNIRQSLQLEKILQTTVTEIRHILDCDRVLIYRIFPKGKQQIITESVINPELSLLNSILNENIFSDSCIEFYKYTKVKAIDNIEEVYSLDNPENLCMSELMQQLEVKSKLIVPIFQNGILWGLMLAHQCYQLHQWTEFEIEIMQQISEQVGIAIAQAQLLMDLRESQEQLKDLFENANDLIQLISPEDGRFIYVNRAWKETLKYSEEEIKKLSVFDLITIPEEISSFRQYFERLKNGDFIKQNSIETEYITKTGEIVILEGSANCRFEEGKPTVIRAFLRDVTAKKQAEKKLKSVLQELTYHKIALDEMAIVVIADRNGVINYFNYKFSQTYQYSYEEAVGQTFSLINSHYHPQSFFKHLWSTISQGKVWRGEIRNQAKNGNYYWVDTTIVPFVDDQGKPFQYLSIMLDITERKLAEKALQISEERWQLAVHGSKDGIWDWNVPTNEVFFSPRWKEMRGFDEDEISHHLEEWISRIHPDDAERVWQGIQDHFQRKTPFFMAEYRVKCKDNSYKWILDRGQALWDENGQVIRMAGSESDISDRKLAEAKLLELNQLQQAILDGTNYAIISTDINGIIQVWNRGAENLLGYQAEEIIGKTTPAIAHDPQEILERSYSLSLELGTKIEPSFDVFVAKARLGQIEEREWSMVHKNGRKFPVLLSVCSLRDPIGNITGFLGIAQDLTERKRSAAEIKVAEERFHLAIQAAQDGFWDWDFITNEIYFSPRWKEMIGYNNDELPNTLSSWDKVIFEEDRIAAIKLIEDYNKGRVDRFQSIQRFYHKNGSIVYILSRAIHLKDDQGNVIRMVGAHTDITELQKAQEVLKQQLAAIEAAIDGIAILKDGHYIYLNKAHVEMFGYSHPQELLGYSWESLYIPEQVRYFEQHTFPVLFQQRHWQGQTTAKRRDGSTFVEEVSLTLTDDNLLICVCRDVTERLKAEEKIKASLLEKEVLLREIHHRVKNNLYVISNLLDLQADTLEQEEQRNLFADSQNRIQTMALIHEQLYQSDDLSQVNFANYIQNLVEKLISSYQPKDCKINISLDVEPVTLNLETAIPCGLLINELVTNAFKYAFPDSTTGEIKITLKMDSEQQIYLKISDNGIGIPEDVDWQDSPSLGLRLVNILADQLEATLELDCTQGTSFTLIFQEQSYN
ncbi:Phytochrome-like protein cph2 [Planktothrix tepida]|uniref:histidine kinase n=1 Tax=Planktothrix tepida PCC 9214 TaxID=671072 RepID=A0A1J1LMP7_9CYAN|nr:PAS domain S-box protein [Planktothrix tepida]CAD5939529.1 Phytochrome-like protein cph2 [Planktothrix tepida]CUR33212.1 hypothetical protein PL9214500459 [Planktothrix tepida PCC 9214]